MREEWGGGLVGVHERMTNSPPSPMCPLFGGFTVLIWNTLPYNIVSCKSLGAFKHALYTHFKNNVH